MPPVEAFGKLPVKEFRIQNIVNTVYSTCFMYEPNIVSVLFSSVHKDKLAILFSSVQSLVLFS